MRNNLNVIFQLNQLICRDESDGWGDAEPYLWTVFFKIDGTTCWLNEGLFLEGTATVFTTPGSHGNLGTYDVDAGETINIPTIIGNQSMVLTPIPVPQFVRDAGTDDVTAIAGCIVILMEEDNVSNAGAEAGHRALNAAVQEALNGIIPTLGFTNQSISDEEVAAMTNAITNKVTDAIVAQQGVFENIWSFINADDTIGSKVWKFSGDELLSNGNTALQERWQKVWVPLPPNHPSHLNGYWRGHGDWEILGNINATVIPSCPADMAQELFDSLFGNSASSKSMASMYAFRDKEFLKYKGLSKWWELVRNNTHYLAKALQQKDLVDDAFTLFKAIPSLLKDKKQTITDEQFDFLKKLLTKMSELKAKEGETKKDLSRALDALKMLKGKNVKYVLEFLDKNAPSRYPAVIIERQIKQSAK